MNGLIFFLSLMAWMVVMLVATKDMHIIPALLLIWGSLGVIYIFWKRQYEKQLERERNG